MQRKDIFKTFCDNCGYIRAISDKKRKHRCPKCNSIYAFQESTTDTEGNNLEAEETGRLGGLAIFLYGFLSLAIITYLNFAIKHEAIILYGGRRRRHHHDGPTIIDGPEVWLFIGSLICLCIYMLSAIAKDVTSGKYETFFKKWLFFWSISCKSLLVVGVVFGLSYSAYIGISKNA